MPFDKSGKRREATLNENIKVIEAQAREEWERLDWENVYKIIDSIPKRIAAVVKNKGSHKSGKYSSEAVVSILYLIV
jgi:hypothetical protein